MDIITQIANRVKAKVYAAQTIVDNCQHADKVISMFADGAGTIPAGTCCEDCFRLWHIAVIK